MMGRFSRGAAINGVYAVLALFLGEELFIEDRSPQREGSQGNRIHTAVWKSSDAVIRSLTRIKPLKHGESHLFSISHHRYLGRPFSVDGIRVRRFDPVIEIHMNNKFLNQVIREHHSVVSLAARLIKEANRSLPALAACAASHKHRKVKVLYGTTLIHRGVERFGFSTFPIHNQPSHHFFAWYLRNILRMTNPNARSLLNARPDNLSPKMVAISKQRLIQQHLRQGDAALSTLSTAEA